jgi:hypothetical protein
MFAMEHEEGIDMERDKFFKKGLNIMERERFNEHIRKKANHILTL